jgi:hypothetical protein
MKRIGLLTMALVLALGSLGVAYAAWTDDIAIEGSVNTGDVNLNVVDYSGTWVYKCLDDDSIVNLHGWMTASPPTCPDCANAELVAWAGAGPLLQNTGLVDDGVRVWFENIFPCQDFMVDILLHYDGSVPAKLFADVIEVGGSPALIANLDVDFMAWQLPGFDPDTDMADIHDWLIPANMIDVGHQVHFCDYILVAMNVHLPQDNNLMNLDGTFRARIQAIQWNEYVEDSGFYPYP